MRLLALVAASVASLAALDGGPATAQPYYGYYGSYYGDYYGPSYGYPPPPNYYYAAPRPYPVYYHHYYHHYYHPYYRHYYRYASCGYRQHRAGNIGAVAGAVGGGIIGAAITHGNPAFTMIGAGAGALTGHAIGRNSHPYPC